MGLFNSVNNSMHRKYVMDRLSEVSDIQNISPVDIENVLKQLKMGKSAGMHPTGVIVNNMHFYNEAWIYS